MTVLVGVLAKDGAVIAADSAVTFGPHPQVHTIADRMPKISIVGEKYIVVGTGQVGLSQRLVAIIEREFKATKLVQDGHGIAIHIAQRFFEDVSSTGTQRGGLGALVAYCQGGNPFLCEYPVTDFQPEQKTKDCWYASLGSGQNLADPFLAFLRKTLWQPGQPNIELALFGAVWAIKHAIDVAPGFIAEPIDIAVVKNWDGKGYKAKLLTRDEVDEQLNYVKSADDMLASFRPDGQKTPPMPQPPT